MLVPKGRRDSGIKPPFQTVITSEPTKAVESTGEVFLVGRTLVNGVYKGAVAKLDVMILPEATAITVVQATSAVTTPNESAGWVLTKLPDAKFAVAGMFGNGITKLNEALDILSEVSLTFSPDYPAQTLKLPIISQTYFDSKLVSATNFGSSKNLMSVSAIDPQQVTAVLQELPLTGGNAYCMRLYATASLLYAADASTKQTYLLDTTLAITGTIPDEVFMLEDSGMGYYVNNPLNLGSTIYEIPPAPANSLLFKKDAAGTVILSKIFPNSYIYSIADDYATSSFICVAVATSYPLATSTVKFYLLDKETFTELTVFTRTLAGEMFRYGCMDSRGYSYFPNMNGTILRVPPLVYTPPSYGLFPTKRRLTPDIPVQVVVSTVGVSDGVVLYWTISDGATSGLADFEAISGSVTVYGNHAYFDIKALSSLVTEAEEGFTLELRTGSISGTVVASRSDMLVESTFVNQITPTFLFHLNSLPPTDSISPSIVTVTLPPTPLVPTAGVFNNGIQVVFDGVTAPNYALKLATNIYTPSDMTLRWRFKSAPTTANYQTYVKVEDSNEIGAVVDVDTIRFNGIPTNVLKDQDTWLPMSLEWKAGVSYFYIKGVLQATSGTLPYNTRSLPLTFFFGRNNDGSLGHFDFDEIMFLQGTALANGASSYTVETIPYLP